MRDNHFIAMTRRVALVAALIAVLVMRATAGIVGDAEEELKKLEQERKGHHVVTVSSDPTQDAVAFPSEPSTQASPVPRSARSSAAKRSGKSGANGGVGVVNIEDQSKANARTRPREPKRAGKDRLYSLFGVLVLLALVAVGAALGKEGVREE